MNLNCETILIYYTHKNKKVLCQIKVSRQQKRKLKKTFRSLTQDQWYSFDKKLAKLIANTNDWNDAEVCHTFSIKPLIEVKVQKSKLSLKYFNKCLGAIENEEGDDGAGDDLEEADYVLECLFDFQDEPAIELTDNESQSFKPPLDSSPENSLTYEPYTPTKKKYRVDNIDTVKTPGIDFLETQKDTFSPESLSEIAKDDSTISEEIPNTPLSLRITTRLSSRESSKSSRSDLLNEVIIETGDEIDSSQKDKISKIKPKEKEEIKHSDNKPNEENRRRKHRKRSKTVDEIPLLSKEKTSIHKDDKYNNIKELEEDGFKQSHYEYKKLKKRSQSTEELPTLKKIIREERKMKPLETINENKLKNKKKSSSESISESKTNERSNENSFSSSDDYLEIAHLQHDKKESKTRAKISDDEFEDSNKLNKIIQLKESNDNNSNLNISISSATTESATDTSPSKGKRGRKPKENISTTTTLRRSERSPSKPLRYIEMETIEPSKKNKLKKHKISPTNKHLFGSDNDDDFENNNDVKTSKDENNLKSSPTIFETPVSKKINKSASSSSSSSTKKKRKRDRSSECEQEKRDMSKWLSKKKSTSTDKEKSSTKDHKSKSSSSSSSSSSRPLPLKNSMKDKKEKSDEKTDSRSNSPIPVFQMPSKEELDLIRKKTEITQKENAKLRAELEKMTSAPPKEVEFLSLQKMTVDEILDTFSTYKTDLDEIYENNRRRDYIKGHDGINHCFIIRLLQQNVQMKMLEKLTEVYSNTKTSAQATLFANALLPEWVIRVFMKKFKFTRKEAMDQIKAQEEFQLHLEEQSDNSFMFD